MVVGNWVGCTTKQKTEDFKMAKGSIIIKAVMVDKMVEIVASLLYRGVDFNVVEENGQWVIEVKA